METSHENTFKATNYSDGAGPINPITPVAYTYIANELTETNVSVRKALRLTISHVDPSLSHFLK